jgi:hypothetical protein
MTYFKAVLVGFASVLVGLPIALVVWTLSRSQSGAATVSFSPLGLANHLAGLGVLIIVLFAVGFVPFVFLKKR